MPSLITEHQQWFDESTGALIVDGEMYIGTQNLDPVTNAITVYSDRSLDTAITNPVPIGADGRATSKVWVPAKYSLKILDSSGSQKFIDLDRGSDTELGNTSLINSLGVNDVTADSSPSIESYVGGQTYIFSAPANNTGAMTLKIDALDVKAIKKVHDVAMESGDIKADQQIVVVYNATDDWFELQSGVIGSVFGANITLSNASPQIIASATNADLDITTNGTGQLQYNSEEVVTKAAVVSGHVRSGNKQIVDGSGSAATISIGGIVTENSYETFGPTGSGATNIWSDLDNVPSSATILLIDVRFTLYNGGTNGADVSVSLAKGDITPGAGALTAYAKIAASSGTGSLDLTYPMEVPIDSNQRFKCTWNNNFGSFTSIVLGYRGFLID